MMFHLNYGCKVSLMYIKVGFYCENPASTEKQEVDALLVDLSG